MKTKKSIYLLLVCSIVMTLSCTKQEYYDIPTGPNGTITITGVSSATSAGITTLDDKFTVNVTFPNAKPGDIMKVELLKLQPPPAGGSDQLLPMAGTQKDVTVGADLKSTVTYTRVEAKMTRPGDYVTVTFAGKTDAGIMRVDLKNATTISAPEYGNKPVEVMRNGDTAFIDVMIQPKLASFSGTLVVRRKNGTDGSWINVSTVPAAAIVKVPVSGNDFATGRDTMFYSVVAKQGTYSDSVNTTLIVSDPSFFLKKTGSLSLTNAAQGGMNIVTNTSVPAGDANAFLSVTGTSLMIKGGAAMAGKSISFVPSTLDLYNKNNSAASISAFQAGTPVAVADPNTGNGIFIYKLVNGPLSTDVIYGMIRILKIVPGVSVDYEYRIGNVYAHLAVIK